MFKINFSTREWFFLLHLVMGFVFFKVPFLTKYLILAFTGYGLVSIVKSRNRGYQSAHFYAAYLVGFEILMRMTKSTIVWEYGKLGVTFFLFIGLLVETRYKTANPPIIVYILCLLPSLLLVPEADIQDTYYGSTFELFTFNLSGPIALCMSGYYFYKRKISLLELREIFYWILMPLLTIVVYIFFVAGSYETIVYNFSANGQESGGYGPNQVSTILGMGIFILGIAFIFKFRYTKTKYLDVFLIAVFFYRCLLTFSRGGLLTAILSLILMMIAMNAYSPRKLISPRVLFGFVLFLILGFAIEQQVNSKTGGKLEQRYEGETTETDLKGKKIYFNGRDRLVVADLEVFLDHPLLGVGPGLAQNERAKSSGFAAASHTELSRMLSEHGLFGLVALLILIFAPYREFKLTKNYYNKVMLIGCVTFALVSMSHAAMRTAAPGFFYGLAFINIYKRE